MQLRFRPLVALLAFVASCVPAFASVLVVSSTGPYTTIQSAIDAAADGDVVLVRPGTYAGFVIDAKSVDVIGGAATIAGRVEVRTLIAARSVSLSGLTIQNTVAGPSLVVTAALGAVRVQDCTVRGPAYPSGWGRAAEISGSRDVAITRCSLSGTSGGIGVDGATAVIASGSFIAFYDTSVSGGVGGDDYPPPAGDNYIYGGYGGDALALQSGCVVVVSGCQVLGGSGGFAHGGFHGDGGAGIDAVAANLRLLDSLVLSGSSPSGNSIPNLINGGGTTTTWPGTSRHVDGSVVVHEQGTVTLQLRGNPGDNVVLIASQGTQWSLSDPWRGVLLVRARQPPIRTVSLGPVDGTGQITFSYPIGDLGLGVESLRYTFQALFVSPSGTTTLSSPRKLVLLDAAF